MGRCRRLLCGAVSIRHLSRTWAALLLVMGACTQASTDGTTSTSEADPSSTTTTTSTTSSEPDGTSATTSTTEPAPPPVDDPETGVLITFPGRIEVHPTTGGVSTVLGDESRSLRIAFDDLNEGVVYQYRQTPPDFGNDAVLHLPRGSDQPIELIAARPGESLELVDVSLLDGLVTVVVVANRGSQTALVSLPLTGGAPVDRIRVSTTGVEPPADNSFLYRAVLAGSVGGDVIAHLIDSDNACNFAEARRTDTRFLVDPLVTACESGAATAVDLNVDGSLLAYVVEGESAFARGIDLERMAPTGMPTIPAGGLSLDLSDQLAIVTYRDGYLLTDFVATRFVEVDGNVQAVTGLRSVPRFELDAFLGGFRTPESCSGITVGSLDSQTGLPPVVDATRDAIGEAIRDCDFLGLQALTGPDFTASFGGGEALDLWADQELRGLTPLADILLTLELPFTVIESSETDIYVWPSAFRDDPTEADWQALEALYNEEEIELWRTAGYTGLRVGITAEGTWIYAVAGD